MKNRKHQGTSPDKHRKQHKQPRPASTRMDDALRLGGPAPGNRIGGEVLEHRMKFWVSDLLEFQSNSKSQKLKDRLEEVPKGDVLWYFSPFYFDAEEAAYMQSQPMPSGKTLGQEWTERLEKASARGVMPCTSHHLAPLIMQAFNLRRDDLTSRAFKNAKQSWVDEVSRSRT